MLESLDINTNVRQLAMISMVQQLSWYSSVQSRYYHMFLLSSVQ